MSLRRLLRDERGQASAELMGMLWWLMIAALAVWQLMLGAWTVTQTSNAARTASRVSAREGADPRKAAREALSSPLRKRLRRPGLQARGGHRDRQGADPDHPAGHHRHGLRRRAQRDAAVGELSHGPA